MLRNRLNAATRNRKGFTLIELLVVVLILSILMAVALPLYLSAVSDSQRKTCRANMQTIANAVQAARVKNGCRRLLRFCRRCQHDPRARSECACPPARMAERLYHRCGHRRRDLLQGRMQLCSYGRHRPRYVRAGCQQQLISQRRREGWNSRRPDRSRVPNPFCEALPTQQVLSGASLWFAIPCLSHPEAAKASR